MNFPFFLVPEESTLFLQIHVHNKIQWGGLGLERRHLNHTSSFKNAGPEPLLNSFLVYLRRMHIKIYTTKTSYQLPSLCTLVVVLHKCKMLLSYLLHKVLCIDHFIVKCISTGSQIYQDFDWNEWQYIHFENVTITKLYYIINIFHTQNILLNTALQRIHSDTLWPNDKLKSFTLETEIYQRKTVMDTT
jgi:hypothetical protein